MRRKWITFTRIFRYGLDNFSRNTWLTTAATAVMTVTLVIVLSTLVIRMIFNDTIAQVRQKIDISVYLKDDVTDTQRADLTTALKKVPIVSRVDYISKDEARKDFEQQSGNDYAQLQALGELDSNPLPASLRITTTDPNKINQLDPVIQKYKDLQSDPPSNSGARKEAIDNIARISQFSETAGLVACVIFLIISIMIIFNTIRMAIFNRRDEIEMMKLIGADKRFIRGPFIVEACLYGVLAAAVSVVLVYVVLLTRAPGLSSYDINVQPTIDFFRHWPILIILGQMLVGIFVGILSSFLAIRRYLKV